MKKLLRKNTNTDFPISEITVTFETDILEKDNKELLESITSAYRAIKKINPDSGIIRFYKLLGEFKLSESYMEKNIDLFDSVSWSYVSQFQKLSEKFIDAHKENVVWPYILRNQNISREFIVKHAKYIDWRCIDWSDVPRKILSEDFIIKIKDYVDFDNLPDEYFTIKIVNQCYEKIKFKSIPKKLIWGNYNEISNEARLYFTLEMDNEEKNDKKI